MTYRGCGSEVQDSRPGCAEVYGSLEDMIHGNNGSKTRRPPESERDRCPIESHGRVGTALADANGTV